MSNIAAMNSIKQLQLTGQLPSPKGVALAIMQISQREDAVLGEVAKVVQTDPALSSRLLRLANSASNASCNSGRALVSIEEAVLRLGMKTVRQLATGFSLVDQYTRGPCEGFDYPGFWSHSLLVAVASQELGKAIRAGAPDELISCGLLAQIGELAMATVYPLEYAAILKQQTSGAARRA